MRLLTRYVFRELVPPTLIGFGFYTFIILVRTLFDLAELVIQQSLPTSTIGSLLLTAIPHIVVLTLPMALLVGILIAIGRLSSDSEIIAMRSAGIPASSVYRPVFLFSLIVFAITLWMMIWVVPRTNHMHQRRKAELLGASASAVIKPRVFFDNFQNYVIYVDDVAPDGTWKGVFISDRSNPDDELVTVAASGRLSYVPDTRQLWLELDRSTSHVYSRRNPEQYDLIRSGLQRVLLVDRRSDQAIIGDRAKSYREMSIPELYAAYRSSSHPIDRESSLLELHKKFAIPFACIAFGIVALPLGITNRRGGKSSGFSISIAIILVYYILLNSTEDLARTGEWPGWLIWVPNVVIVALGMWLIRRANRDTGASGVFASLMEMVTGRFGRRKTGQIRHDDTSASPLSRLDLPFPTTIDRYVVSEFVRVLLLVLVSTVVLFVVIDYAEVAGEMRDSGVGIGVVIEHYQFYILQILNWMLPLSILLATLITFGILAKSNEVTAIKSSGMSLYRLSLPIILIGLLASLVSYLLLDYVLPYSNERATELRAQIEGRTDRRAAFSPDQRQWVFGRGRHLFNFTSAEAGGARLEGLQVFEFHPTEFRVTRRIFAASAVWNGERWEFQNGWVRSFGDDGSASFTPIRTPIELQYQERPEFFIAEVKTPDEMNFNELRRYIQELRASGYSADPLEVRLYEKTSWPFISFVMALIALPFAFSMGRRGAMHGIGIAMILAFVYWILFGFFTKFGEAGNLPPLLAAWSANVLFAIAAVWMFLRVET